ncbi:twin-arginine translocase subunit TatC [Luteimicrobium sp. NPDC057192]|uniref:twin-arginine translocase subunit TatC n=1 Tax=Luteimicrobium sp. NPDC057192 TaxID=3346042 RepID=UPI00363D117C
MATLTSDPAPDLTGDPAPGPRTRDGRGRMTLRAHLAELRRRAFLAAAGLAVGAAAGWALYDPLLAVLMRPLSRAASAQGAEIALNFASLGAPLDVRIKVSLFLAVLITCPWWLYQGWAFVTPGLTGRERRYTVGFLAGSVPLFLLGGGLAWWMLPHAVDVLSSFVPDGAAQLLNAQDYLTFVMRLVLAFGVAFVTPALLVALNFAGIVRHEPLARAWRWAVLLAFVFAAVMTPTPDALTMVAVAVPICALYLAALAVTTWHDRSTDQRA